MDEKKIIRDEDVANYSGFLGMLTESQRELFHKLNPHEVGDIYRADDKCWILEKICDGKLTWREFEDEEKKDG